MASRKGSPYTGDWVVCYKGRTTEPSMPLSRVTRQITPPCVLLGWLLLAAMIPATAAAQAPARDDDPGIPIENAAVREACGSCHAPDDAGRLSRISFRRTTPEGWQQTIRRMVTLNDATIAPETAREVVRFLANTLGLAPDEARLAAYEVERRADDQPYDDAEIRRPARSAIRWDASSASGAPRTSGRF